MLYQIPGFCRYRLHLHLHLGFVHPLQGVALHQCLPSSSVCCFPNPGGSLLLCYVILPSCAWSSSRPLPSPWLTLCASPCPPYIALSTLHRLVHPTSPCPPYIALSTLHRLVHPTSPCPPCIALSTLHRFVDTG